LGFRGGGWGGGGGLGGGAGAFPAAGVTAGEAVPAVIGDFHRGSA
jgi:hypothetical protein